MATTQPAPQPAAQPTQPPSQPPAVGVVAPPTASGSSDVAPVPNPFASLGSEQVMALLKTLGGTSFYQGAGARPPGADPKDSAMAAEALSHMATSFPHLPPGVPPPFPHYQMPGMEPDPSSHPRGPPNLGNINTGASPNEQISHGSDGQDGPQSPGAGPSSPNDSDKPKTAGRRTGRSATMSNDEWARQRKDNHKEVERRRRGNINDGINELGRIVPNGSGEKAKGAILSRAVQYIHHLKENEARNIEKWTLEKLLMDQAMGDLQAQLEEVRRAWEEERAARQRLEAELQGLRGQSGPTQEQQEGEKGQGKRSIDEVEGGEESGEKRARVD